MSKIWAIAWKNVYLTFRDRNTLLTIIATPLALSLIIGLAFGGGSGSGISFENIPVALVNLDEGVTQNNTVLNYGNTFNTILLPSTDTVTPSATVNCSAIENGTPTNANTVSLNDLLAVTAVKSIEEAKLGVDNGNYTAAIIIPSDFSQRLNDIANTDPNKPRITLEVYGTGGSPIQSSVVKSITESIANQLITGNVAITSTINTLVERAQSDVIFGAYFATLSASGTWQPNFDCAFTPDSNTLTIKTEAVTLIQEQSDFVQILITVGTGQAIFFALFTGQFGFLAIYEERKAGTLPRLMVAPITRRDILTGYVVGVFLTVLVQLVILMISLTVVASVLEGSPQFIWGTNIPSLILIILGMTTAVCGLGMVVVAFARTPQQSQVIGSILNTFMAALGGTFGFSLPDEVSYFSPIWWGKDALYRLSNGSGDIGLHLVVLLGIGALLFVVGLWVFNRKEVM